MRFKLFGRLRDEEEEEQNSNEQDTASSMDFGGNTLQRTVENMFSQGYSQEEIKDELRGQYSPNRIEKAVNDAVATSAAGGNSNDGPEPMTPYQENQGDAVSPVDQGFQEGQQDMNSNSQENPPPQPQGGRSHLSLHSSPPLNLLTLK